jgi:dihydroorotate dehydrogenase
MVNKGFKNNGINQTLKDLQGLEFINPVGISIGRTNTKTHKTQAEAEEDIINSFKIASKSKIQFSYYELNISCPNLYGNIEFYSVKNLENLLKKVSKLNLKKPIFIKMPINKTDKETLVMLEIIAKYPIKGVIFGNLQKDRNNKSLVKSEVEKFEVGNFSGKPCEARSNELIALCHKHHKGKLMIIGCGGVFSGRDAYKKIRLGANLVQLATGLVYKGPTLPGRINMEIVNLLKKDGFESITEAVGTISR